MFDKSTTICAWEKPNMSANHGVFHVTFSQSTEKIYVSNIRTPGLVVIDGQTNEYLKLIPFDSQQEIFRSDQLYFLMAETAWNALNRKIYTVTYDPAYLLIIDEDSETCTNKIRLDSGARGISIDEKNGNVFISHYGSGWYGGDNKVSVFDLDNKLIRKIEVGLRPWEMACDQENNRTYISCKGSNLYTPGELWVLDNSTLEVIDKIKIGRRPRGIAINTKMDKLYSTARSDFSTYVFDSNTLDLKTIIANDCDPISSTYNPQTNKLYMINRQGKMKPDEVYKGSLSTVQILDCSEDKIIKSLEIGKTGHYGAINPNNNFLYIPCEDSLDIWIIDTNKDTVVGKIDVGRCLDNVKLDKKRKLIFSTSHITDEVSVFNLKTDKHIKSFELDGGGWPYGIDIDEDLGTIYVNDHDEGNIAIFDKENFDPIKNYSLGIDGFFTPGRPIVEHHKYTSSFSGIAVDEKRKKVYSVSARENSLYILDEKEQTIESIYLGWQEIEGFGTFDVVVNENKNSIYVLNPQMLKIMRIDGNSKQLDGIINLEPFPIDASGYYIFLIRLLMNENANKLYVGPYIVDLESNEVDRISEQLGDVIVSRDKNNKRLFVYRTEDITINVVDEGTFQILDTFKLDRFGTAFEYDADLMKFIVLPVLLYSSEIDIYKETTF